MQLGDAMIAYQHPLNAEESVNAWNARFAIGQEVAVPMAIGAHFACRTTSKAYVRDGKAWVTIPIYDEVLLFNVCPLQDGTLDKIPD